MENVSYIGLSQQLALQQQMEMTANNIANASTAGFKSQNPLFNTYLVKPKDGTLVKQSYNYGSYRDLTNGSLTMTHNSLDVALQGEGYFAVETPAGIRYTRDGGFGLNANRELVTKAGYRVLGGGGPIAIPAEARNVTITPQGMVTTEAGEVAQLTIARFDNEQAMTRMGDNLYDPADQAPQEAPETRVVQGAVEASNVNPVIEMNRMIEVLRAFQGVHRMLQNDHDRIRNTIQKLTRV